jgi:two-component system NarL family response regulator
VTVRVLLVDDHQIVREGLRSILEREADVQVIGEAGDGRTALAQVQERGPDVVVMDIAMPDMNGVEATRRLRSETPGVQVVALSAYPDKRYVLAMLEAGAQGFVVKSGAAEELLSAIRAVSRGQSYLSPRVAGSVIRASIGRLFPEEPSAYTLLSAREREVVQLLAEGKTSKEIGARLHVSAKTVEAHRRNLMRKLDLHSVADLTKYAVREGLTSLDC